MKLAIMQPYFFPYLGYFSLIKSADRFIIFDTPQFIRHGWIERNQILNFKSENLYIKVPLNKNSLGTPINEMTINNNLDWRKKIYAQLVVYKKKAPFYKEVIRLIEDIFRIETFSIVELNKVALMKVCNYLNIHTPISTYSSMDIEIEEVKSPDEWALNICKALNAKSYINPKGGQSFFDIQKFVNEGVDISFLHSSAPPYVQLGQEFIPFLSIIDVMMFNDVEVIADMLDKYTIK
jgi:hypothetical protein